MPVGLFKSKKQSKEAKRRFENLMVLAKENPDKIFDLTACELSVVPPSIFVQCRVFLTENLLLHTNLLKSLKGGGKMDDLSGLRVLDLHDNVITNLPENIGDLSNLQVLNVENNKLSELPQSIGQLRKLQTLLARDNFLNCIPSRVKEMSSLRTLDISGTNSVYFLPKTLCYVRTLEALILSKPHCMEYPPPMVASEGLEAIQKFICKDCGVEYVPPSHNVLKVLDQTDGPCTSHKLIHSQDLQTQTSIEQYQRKKDEQRKHQLEIERQVAENQRTQAVLSAKSMETKAKEQASLKEKYANFDKSMREQQSKKEKERIEMLKMLKEVEQEASGLLENLLSMNTKARQQEALLEKMERQRIEQEEYFKVTQEDLDKLRKKETLVAMESILAENDQYNLFIEKYLGEQSFTRRKAQESIGQDDVKINEELKRQQCNQGSLVQQILVEENLQKEAFAALQFQRDAVQMRLLGQISQLQGELSRLTQVEARRKKMKVALEQESLQLIRTELTDLLIQLLKEKDQREEMLKDRLNEMEQQKEDDQVDFWLVQYQRLLDSKPQVLIQKEQGLDVEIVKLLQKCEASHHTSSFARHKVTMDNVQLLDDSQLQSIGVFEIGLRNNILREIENLVAQRKKVDLPYEPESPAPPAQSPVTVSPESPASPSAPTEEDMGEVENECVICLDRASDSVLLPCGHVCSCHQCSINLTKCPMCRTEITQKIRIYRS